MSRGPGHRRRCFVLIAVLVIVGSALLVVTSLLFMTQSEVASLGGAHQSAQSRALAWSGAQVVMTRLDLQRDEILRAGVPRLDDQYEIYEAGGRLGVVRLLPMRADGARLLPEASKIDLNTADAEMLFATGWIDTTLARAIVEHRDRVLGRPFQSVGELLQVPGVTPELLHGPLEDIGVMDDAQLAEIGITERVETRLEGNAIRGLADLVTVYGFEPALQRDGRLRINVNVPWSDELGRRVDDRFGDGASAILKGIMDSGTRFDGEGVVYAVLVATGMSVEDWPDIIDALTTDAGGFHFGRLDINTAPYEALLALPGIEPEQAAAIVQRRDELPDEDKSTVAWPAILEILPREAYPAIAPYITVRSWTYRVRLAAGEVDAEAPDGPMENPIIYEAVIDLSAPRPRVAYLRDVTMLQTTAAIALAEGGATDEETWSADEGDPSDVFGDEDETGTMVFDATDWPGDPMAPPDDLEDDDLEDPGAEAGSEAMPVALPAPENDTPVSPGRRVGRWQPGG